ncbi:Olfactory receptor 14C36 [Heterocephalus glaber]|uniref:Olfactory receptor 14C36 n=1 Tax=Heterocephalus glaber TaxID=10181 RepID=G5BIY4_HETGA|nr:olfactory receptor 14C36 [Heterocephalus glaber]EHB09245.1 Olfactory receptor 14C36 [Heterocephalus glaber]
MTNSTMMMDFLLMEISGMWDLRVFYAMFFSLIYVVTLMGNLIIAAVTTLDKSLHTPMYFFLRNLSILDSCYISVTVPNSCMNSLLGASSISKAGCAAQVFLVLFFGFVELLFLTIMAHDRFAAICRPLHYPVIMSPRLCVHSTLAIVLSGIIYASLHTNNTFRLSFCHSRAVQQLFCDIPSLLKLSCSDTFSNQISIFVSALVIGGGSFTYIIKSYIHIFSTVLRFPVGVDRKKAFSTCVPHILVVSVFLWSGFFVYLRPSAMSSGMMGMVLSVFYSVIPPLFNPIIYSLRNEQIKFAIRKLMTRMLYSGNILKIKEAFPIQLSHCHAFHN